MVMELANVMKLVEAGFTKEEIMQMEQKTEPVPQNEPEQKEEPVPQKEPEPVPAPTPVPEQKDEQPTMADIMHSIAKLTSAVQANAIAQSILPNGGNAQPTAEDMVAQIIRPTITERR